MVFGLRVLMRVTSICPKSLATSYFYFVGNCHHAHCTSFLDLLDVVTVGILLKLFGVLSIGTLGFCAVGVLLAGMSTSANGGESLLSVVLLPLVIPIINGRREIHCVTSGNRWIRGWVLAEVDRRV